MRIRRPALLAGAAALLIHAVLVRGLLAIDAAPRWRDDRPPRLQALYVRTIEPQPQVLPEPPGMEAYRAKLAAERAREAEQGGGQSEFEAK